MLIAIRLAAPTIRDNSILRSSRSDDHIAEHVPRTGCYLRRWSRRRRCPPCPCWRSRTRRKSGTADVAAAAMAAAFSKTAAVPIRYYPRSPELQEPQAFPNGRVYRGSDQYCCSRGDGTMGLGPGRRRGRARRAHGGPPPEGELPITGTGGGHAPPLFTDQPGRQSAMRAAQVSVPVSRPYRSDASTVTRGDNSVVGAALFGDLQLRRAWATARRLTTVRYRRLRRTCPPSAARMRKPGRARRRNGVRGWTLRRDVADPAGWTERFESLTWLAHLRKLERGTVADEAVRAQVRTLRQGNAPPASITKPSGSRTT